MIRERGGVIQGDAHQKHWNSPAKRAEHALMSILIRILAEQRYDRRVGQCYGRSTKELTNQDDQQQQKECLLNVLQYEQHKVPLSGLLTCSQLEYLLACGTPWSWRWASHNPDGACHRSCSRSWCAPAKCPHRCVAAAAISCVCCAATPNPTARWPLQPAYRHRSRPARAPAG